jgi:hypothetical protein
MGIIENTLWEGLYTSLTVTTPIVEMTIPDAKLAPAEKHISFSLLLFSI